MNWKPQGQYMTHTKCLANTRCNYYSYHLNLHCTFSGSSLSTSTHVVTVPSNWLFNFSKKCLAFATSIFLLLLSLPTGILIPFLSILILLAQQGHILPLFQGWLLLLHLQGVFYMVSSPPLSHCLPCITGISTFLVNYNVFKDTHHVSLSFLSPQCLAYHLANVLKKYFLAVVKLRTQRLIAGVR